MGAGSRATTPISHLPATHSGVIKGPTRAHGKRAGEVHLVVVIEYRTRTTWQRLKIDVGRRRLLPTLLLSTFSPQRHQRPGGQRKRWPRPGGAERRDERIGILHTDIYAPRKSGARANLQFASPRRLRIPFFLSFSCAFPILHSLTIHRDTRIRTRSTTFVSIPLSLCFLFSLFFFGREGGAHFLCERERSSFYFCSNNFCCCLLSFLFFPFSSSSLPLPFCFNGVHTALC